MYQTYIYRHVFFYMLSDDLKPYIFCKGQWYTWSVVIPYKPMLHKFHLCHLEYSYLFVLFVSGVVPYWLSDM